MVITIKRVQINLNHKKGMLFIESADQEESYRPIKVSFICQIDMLCLTAHTTHKFK